MTSRSPPPLPGLRTLLWLRLKLFFARRQARLRAVQDGRPHRHWSVRMLERVCRACRVRRI